MHGVLIQIKKAGDIIGGVMFNSGNITSVIGEIIHMLENYNANLASAVIEDELLAIRFFEMENKDCSKGMDYMPSLSEETKDYLQMYYPGFVIADKGVDRDLGWGTISIIGDEIREMFDKAGAVAVINFDDYQVQFANFIRRRPRVAWEEDEGRSISELPESIYNFYSLPFNELDEACDFIIQNSGGWYCEDSDVVEIPYDE